MVRAKTKPASKSPTVAEPRSKNADATHGYSFSEVLAVTEATQSNLLHWANIGIVKPDLAGAGGTGNHRRFSTFNLIEVQTAAAIVRRFKVPTVVLRGAVNILRSYHLGAVAFYEETNGVPFIEGRGRVITPGVDGSEMPGRVGLFSNERRRQIHAEMFRQTCDGHLRNGVLGAEHAAHVWHELRESPAIHGVPVPEWNHIVALVVGDDVAQVVIDPRAGQRPLDEVVMEIDLTAMVWRVGEKNRRLGAVALAPW